MLGLRGVYKTIPGRVKQSFYRKALSLYQDKAMESDLKNMSFDNKIKLLLATSEGGTISNLVQSVDQEIEKLEPTEHNLKEIVKTIHFLASNETLENYERLVRKLDRYLRRQEVITKLNASQIAKLIYGFAYASDLNISRYPILDRLVRNIEEQFEMLEEQDVLTLISAYKHI